MKNKAKFAVLGGDFRQYAAALELSRKGICVYANGLSVAEHAFTLMMALAKNLVPVAQAYKDIGFAAKNSKGGFPPPLQKEGVHNGAICEKIYNSTPLKVQFPPT